MKHAFFFKFIYVIYKTIFIKQVYKNICAVTGSKYV